MVECYHCSITPNIAPVISLITGTFCCFFCTAAAFQILMLKDPTGYGFTIKGPSPVCVVKVKRASSAAAAGLAPGDFIERINGQNVTGLSDESVLALIT